MTKEKHVSRNKHRQSRRHPTSIRLIAGLLCICLSVMSLPGGTSSFLALAAEKKEVVTFPALPEEIRMQTAKPGTELEELELPDTLMAVCRFAGENYQGVKQLAQELSAQVRPKQDALLQKLFLLESSPHCHKLLVLHPPAALWRRLLPRKRPCLFLQIPHSLAITHFQT